MNETWRPIPGFPHYLASDHGRIRSVDRPYHPGRVLKQHSVTWGSESGYRQVVLRENYAGHTMKVHRLVALAFLPNPDSKPMVRHLDGNPENNHVENLAWGDHVENMADMVGHGRHLHARKTHCPAGHPYEGPHLQVVVTGKGAVIRQCKTCKNARRKAAYQARKGAA